ncbi:NUDIX hydrolase [Candidatus Latescibacterota bacterium]
MEPQWLVWTRRLQALAQNGLAFTDDPFDRERYEELRQIAAEMAASGTADQVPTLVDLFSRDSWYATPKIDMRGAVFNGDRLLFVKEKSDGRWTLPGGFADVGSSPAENVAREVREESGFSVRPIKILAVYDRSRHPHPPHGYHVYKIFVLCDLEGGRAQSSIETTEVDFFPEDEIPPLSVARVTAPQIDRVFAHHRHPDRPTDFD